MARAGLVGDAAEVDLVLHVQVARDQMIVHVELVEHRLQLLVEFVLRHLIRRRVVERDRPLRVDGDAIFLARHRRLTALLHLALRRTPNREL